MTKIVHEPVALVTNPETEETVYPYATPDGYGVLSNGAVPECDCEDCLAKYEV